MAKTNVTTIKILVDEYVKRINEKYASIAIKNDISNNLKREMNKKTMKVIVNYATAQYPHLKYINLCGYGYNRSSMIESDKITIAFEAKPTSDDIEKIDAEIRDMEMEKNEDLNRLSEWKEKALISCSKNQKFEPFEVY